jgi:serine-type D-Ala-D-Ala carboxypeptidase/endopeptidase (penicillin-binding protein 4)
LQRHHLTKWKKSGLSDRLSGENGVIVALTPTPAGICPAQLPTQIAQITQQPRFDRARWGILIQTLTQSNSRTPKTLYAQEANRFFLAASTVKLFTTAAALEKLGSRHRIRTAIVGTEVSPGLWDLRLIGKGDPSFGDAQVTNLVQQLQRRGVKGIRQLVFDDRAFPGEVINPTWEWGDLQESYAPIVNSLIINQNTIKFSLAPTTLGQPLRLQWQHPQEIAGWTVENLTKTVSPKEPEFTQITRDGRQPLLRIYGQLQAGSTAADGEIAAPDPLLIWRDRFQTALTQAKIPLQQASLLPPWSKILPNAKETEIAFVESPPMADLIREINQESNNLYAEALLKQLATIVQPGESTTDSGLQTLQTTLTRLQVNSQSYQLVDGSGLSRQNLVSPESLVQVLQGMATAGRSGDFRRSLPVAGRSGSLSNRLRHPPVQDIVQAKTGTLTNVVALAGYVSPPQYPPLAFSILLNQATAKNSEQRQAIDQIVTLLAQLRECPSP